MRLRRRGSGSGDRCRGHFGRPIADQDLLSHRKVSVLKGIPGLDVVDRHIVVPGNTKHGLFGCHPVHDSFRRFHGLRRLRFSTVGNLEDHADLESGVGRWVLFQDIGHGGAVAARKPIKCLFFADLVNDV